MHPICRVEAVLLNQSQYPDDWHSRRRRVYQRDKYACQHCGANNQELHAHHIVPISAGGNHNMSNLVTLCADCHNAAHGGTLNTGYESQYEFEEGEAFRFFLQIVFVFVSVSIITIFFLIVI